VDLPLLVANVARKCKGWGRLREKKQKLLSALFAQQCHFVITHWLTFGGKMFFVLEGLLQAHVHQDARM